MMPGLQPYRNAKSFSGYPEVLTTARAFLADATPIAAQFIEYEMPANFIADLTADIAAFEAAEWFSASRVERSPSKAAPVAPKA